MQQAVQPQMVPMTQHQLLPVDAEPDNQQWIGSDEFRMWVSPLGCTKKLGPPATQPET